MTALTRDQLLKANGLMDVTPRHVSGPQPASDTIEFSLETKCGAALRYRMPKAAAADFAAGLRQAVYGEAVQNDRSVGKFMADGSPADGHVPAPITRSDNALTAET